MVNNLEIGVNKGDVTQELEITKLRGGKFRVLERDDLQLAIESDQQTENNAARAALGTTISTSEDGEFSVAPNGDLIRNRQTNTVALKWIVVDFHQERLVNEIALTIGSSTGTEEIRFDLKLWGGSIFFSPSPLAQGAFSKSTQPQTIALRFAEQKTQKVLIEFGTLVNKIFESNKSVILINLQIKAFSFPVNLSLRVGEQSPFFSYPDELAPGILLPLPEFSEEINSYLDNNEPRQDEESLYVPLILGSKTDGRVRFKLLKNDTQRPTNANIVNLGFRLQGHVTEFFKFAVGADHFQEIELNFNGQPAQQVFLPIPANVLVSEAAFFIKGSLTLITSDHLGALGSEEFLLAQRFDLKTERVLAAVDLQLEFLTREAELSIAIHPDYNRQPSNTPLPDMTVGLKFPIPNILEKTNAPVLVKIQFPSTGPLKPGSYWVVLTTAKGRLTWRIKEEQPNPGGFVFTRLDGPVNWIARTDPNSGNPLSGRFKIHYQPEEPGWFLTLKIGDTEGMVPGIIDPGVIDTNITSILIGKKKHNLSDLLNNAISGDPIPLLFFTDYSGTLTLSQLDVKFEKK